MSDPVAVALISSMIGGLLVAVVNFLFYRPKIAAETKKLLAEAEKVRVEIEKIRKDGENTSIALKAVEEQAEDLLRQGRYYDDFSEAFVALEKCIKAQVAKQSNNGIDHPVIEIKHIAVAMSYSWDNFINTKFKRILEQNDEVSIKFEAVFIDAEFLKRLKIDTKDKNWAFESEQRIKSIPGFLESMEKFKERFSCSFKIYQNIPHWHGWLVKHEQAYFLFLGRTKWEFTGALPKLTVGQNEYRYYDTNSRDGIERIRLFQQWHRYYHDYVSQPVIAERSDAATTG
jgi:hypothetical protein